MRGKREGEGEGRSKNLNLAEQMASKEVDLRRQC